MKTKILSLIILFGITACTDADFSKLTKPGDKAKITCYSGGKIIYDGESTGAVSNESGSDGYYFRDKETKKLVEVSADCIFRYEN